MYKDRKISSFPSITAIAAILSALGTAFFLVLILITNLCHFTYHINSDNASDVILAKLIWETKEWIPQSWYAAAELRLLLTPNLSALFYGLTDNAVLATGLGCCMMTLGIILSIWYCLAALKINFSAKLLVIFLCLMLPGDFIMLELTYLFASYYATHVIVLFLTLGFYSRCLTGRFNWLIFIILSGLALLLGMQGVRGILITFGPLLGIELLRNVVIYFKKRRLIMADLRILGTAILFLIISFIGTLFPFSIGQEIHRNIRNGLAKLITVVMPDVRRAIGFDVQPFWGQVIMGVLCLVVMTELILLVIKLLRQGELDPYEWLELMLIASPALTILAVSFTTVESTPRYYFIIPFAMAVCMGKHANRLTIHIKAIPKILAGAATAGIILLSFLNLERNYLPVLQEDGSHYQAMTEVVDYLRENEFSIAYASFDNANAMTVLANCEITVAAVADAATMEICKWISSTEWYVPNRPYEEKTAYIFTEEDRKRFLTFLDKNQYREDITEEHQIGQYFIFTAPYNFSSL